MVSKVQSKCAVDMGTAMVSTNTSDIEVTKPSFGEAQRDDKDFLWSE